MSFKKAIDLIFCRMHEPAFIAKGNAEHQQAFNVPDTFIDSRYGALKASIAKANAARADETGVKPDNVRQIVLKSTSLPNIKYVLDVLRRADMFSLFIPTHRKIAQRLIEFFRSAKTLDELQTCAVFARDHINPFLFNYTLSVALLNRNDTADVMLPTCAELFPDRFLNCSIFQNAWEELAVVPDDARAPIVLDMLKTSTDRDPEQRLAYFREDLGVNLCYFNWHLIYPFETLDRNSVARDRRGELWYYLHQQILARYNNERVCNDLFRVKPLNNLREPIKEAYFPQLNIQNSSHTYPPRFENCTLSDLDRPKDLIKLSITQLEHWIDRIVDAIEMGFALKVRMIVQ